MNKPFEFADFVDEFRVPLLYLDHQEGFWNDEGDYVEEQELPRPMSGIVLPLSDDDLRYAEAGTFSKREKKVYTTIPLQEGRQVEYNGDRYTIQSFRDYSEYADVYIYLMRWREND